MQRYEPKPWDIRHCDMVPANEGEYVLYCAAQAEIERMGRELNLAKYGEPNFSWSIHKKAMDDLLARAEKDEAKITQLRFEIEKLREDYTELLGSNEALTFKLVDAEAERDEARAQVAAAFEAAANASMESGPSYFMTQTGGGFQETHTKLGAFAFRTDIRDAIRTLTPADAKAALEAYGREKMREGMQRAVDIAEKCWESVYSQQTKEMIRVEMEKLK